MPLSTSELATLSGLLEQGLDLPADERASWLGALPDEHSGLRPMLKQLLARADAPETADLLHTLPKFDRGRALPVADHSTGERVGPYMLLRPLGHGGMGTVWLAERADGALTRQVALKLPLMAAQPLMRQRLARERDILAGLEHPHIARLYDAGIDASGQPYLALEYVDGEQIDTYCKTHAPDLRTRLTLFLQVASAVAYAHAHLVLHRDLKPSNILVTGDGQVRLLDFGIARLLEADAAQDSDLTQQAGRALTPDYASPEQILGQPMTVASDVYGLGIVLYEMLTGERPYRLRRDSHGSLQEAIAAAAVAPPSTVVADPRIRRQLAGDLDTIVLKALKKEATERYPTANALIEDIERMQAGLPIVARPDSMGYRLRKLVARNRVAVAAAAMVLLAVLVGAAVALWQARAAAVERDRALALLDRNQTALDFINVMITEAVPADEKVTRSDLLARSEQIANRMFAANPEQLATVLSVLASHYASSSDYSKSSALLGRAVTLVRPSGDLALRAEVECNHALTLFHIGNADAARKVLNSWLARGDLDPATAAQCQLYLVQIAWSTNDAKSALENALGARARLAQMARPPPLLEASMLGDLAYAYSINGRNDEADRLFAASLKIYKDLGRDQGNAYLAILNNWQVEAFSAGDIRRAVELNDETLRLSADSSPDGKVPVYVVSSHSVMLVTLGRYQEALAEARRTFELANEAGAASFKVSALVEQSAVFRELGDLDQAERLLAAAAAEVGAIESDAGPAISLQLARARLALRRGRLDEAAQGLEPVIRTFEQRGMRNPRLANALRIRAEVRWRKGDRPAALLDAQRAVDISREAQGGRPYSYVTGLGWLLLGRLRQEAGDTEAARSALQSAVLQLSNTLGDDHPDTRKARLALNP